LQQRCQIFVVQLQGYLFFGNEQKVVEGIELALKEAETEMQVVKEGTASAVTDTDRVVTDGEKGRGGDHSSVYNSVDHEKQQKIKYLILDCSFVTGADVNAIAGLLKMKVHLSRRSLTRELCTVSSANQPISWSALH
jgi:MFS superfamily sulfate permease-like transporter